MDRNRQPGNEDKSAMAGSDYGGGGRGAPPPGGDWSHEYQREPEFANITPTSTRQNGQNGGSYGNQLGRPPASPALSADNTDNESRRSGERNRSRPRGSRAASGQTRICKKCGESLTGQFVRALDGTFHLDCFKCRVSSEPLLHALALLTGMISCRTVVRLSPPSSSPLTTRTAGVNTHSARQTTSVGLVCSVISAAERFEDPTSRHLSGNTTSITSRVPCARQCLGHRTATMSTTVRCIAIITTQPASLNVAKAAKPLSSNSSLRSFATARISIGIPNVT